MKSIIDAQGSKDFVRIRIGIAQKAFFGGIKRPTGEALSKYVLSVFKSGEAKELAEIAERVDSVLKLIIEKGVQSAMQEINKS